MKVRRWFKVATKGPARGRQFGRFIWAKPFWRRNWKILFSY